MEYLETIEPILKIIETGGNRPALVRCDDMTTYVCKHIYGNASAVTLFYELLASEFLQIWGIPTPETALIKVKPSHYQDKGLEYSCFSKTCFGSKYIADSIELDMIFPDLNKSDLTLSFKCDFLKIALFDMWIANEDRTEFNPNLLITNNSKT